MVMVASVPPMARKAWPAVTLRMSTPTAPAFWAFLTLAVKVQVPRLTSAILPATSAGLVTAPQPSPRSPAPVRCTSARSPVRLKACGPKVALGCDSLMPARPAGARTMVRTRSPLFQAYICIQGEKPSAGVVMLALLVPEESCASASSGSPCWPPRP